MCGLMSARFTNVCLAHAKMIVGIKNPVYLLIREDLMSVVVCVKVTWVFQGKSMVP